MDFIPGTIILKTEVQETTLIVLNSKIYQPIINNIRCLIYYFIYY